MYVSVTNSSEKLHINVQIWPTFRYLKSLNLPSRPAVYSFITLIEWPRVTINYLYKVTRVFSKFFETMTRVMHGIRRIQEIKHNRLFSLRRCKFSRISLMGSQLWKIYSGLLYKV